MIPEKNHQTGHITNVFSSFICLVSEYKALNFWESSMQPSSFPWILTSSLYDPPSPQLTITDALSRARGYQSHGQQEQQHLGRSHGVSVSLSLSLSWCCRKLRHTPVWNPRRWYHFSNPWIDTSHRYLICHLGLLRPVGFKVWLSSSLENHTLVLCWMFKIVVHHPQLLVKSIPFCNTHFRTMVVSLPYSTLFKLPKPELLQSSFL